MEDAKAGDPLSEILTLVMIKNRETGGEGWLLEPRSLLTRPAGGTRPKVRIEDLESAWIGGKRCVLTVEVDDRGERNDEGRRIYRKLSAMFMFVDSSITGSSHAVAYLAA